MAKRAAFSLLFCMLMTVCFGNAGCTGTPAKFHEVLLNPSAPQIVGSGTALPISATVLNDTSGAGVTWTAPAHGSLSAMTTASVVYNAPIVASGSTVSDSVKATSVTFPNQSASLSITVEGAPLITTTALPAGNYGSPYTATVAATGGVAPFTWSISAGSLTTGLSVGSSTTNSVTISGTPGAEVNSNFTIKVTDSTGAAATQSLSIAIGAPLALHVTTTTLPNGSTNAAYPATTLQASGGVAPFTWTVTSGSLPAGLSLAADGAISGTPTTMETSNFTVQVADSETTPMTATASLSITVGSLGILSGNYAFELSGFNVGGAVVVAGSFTADGAGGISNGVEDLNTILGPPTNRTFTGTYTLGSDNRGQLIFSSLVGSPTYDFAIDATGANGRLIELDSTGIRGSGQLEQQTVSTCAFSTINGNYAFGVSGEQIAVGGTASGPAVVVGSFTAAAPSAPGGQGSIGPGEADSNAPTGVAPIPPSSGGFGGLSGTFQTSSQASRCTMSFSSVNAGVSSMDFAVYPVSASEAFLVEIDAVNATTTPLLTVGKMLLQSPSLFPMTLGSSFTATSVGGLTGQFLSGTAYEPDQALVSLTGTGGSGFTISILENQGGSVTSYAPAGLSFFNVDQYGRVNPGISSPVGPVFYAINDNEAFCIGTILDDPFFGILEPQSAGPFAASQINGAFVLGTSPPATTSVEDLSGTVTFASTSASSGTITGTVDLSGPGGNMPATAITGTYTGPDPTAGGGLLTLTLLTPVTGDFLIVSPTKILIMSTTPEDVNPILISLGNCETTCGED